MGRDDDDGDFLGKAILGGLGILAGFGIGKVIKDALDSDDQQQQQERQRAKQRQLTPRIYKPSDLNDILDFSVDPLDEGKSYPAHLLYCRLYPLVAATASRMGDIDIQEENPMDYYCDSVEEILQKDHFQTVYMRAFIKASFSAVAAYPHERLPDVLFSCGEYLRTTYQKESWKALVIEAVGFAVCMTARLNMQVVDALSQFASPFGITKEEVLSEVRNNGYPDFGLEQPKEEEPSEEDLELKWLTILGLEKGATNDEVTRAYHLSIRKFHPDTIEGKDLDPAFLAFAQQQTIAINDAYQELKKLRGF